MKRGGGEAEANPRAEIGHRHNKTPARFVGMEAVFPDTGARYRVLGPSTSNASVWGRVTVRDLMHPEQHDTLRLGAYCTGYRRTKADGARTLANYDGFLCALAPVED